MVYQMGVRSPPKWDSDFVIDKIGQLKELKINIPYLTKISLFEISVLNVIQTLGNLQVVELIDENLEPITFDFLYGFVMSLLEKRWMRKISICTKVINRFYS